MSNDNFVTLKRISKELNYNIKLERKKAFASKLTKDPKSYWSAMNQMLGKSTQDEMVLKINDRELKEGPEMANLFADFFQDKVGNLSNNTNSYHGKHLGRKFMA